MPGGPLGMHADLTFPFFETSQLNRWCCRMSCMGLLFSLKTLAGLKPWKHCIPKHGSSVLPHPQPLPVYLTVLFANGRWTGHNDGCKAQLPHPYWQLTSGKHYPLSLYPVISSRWFIVVRIIMVNLGVMNSLSHLFLLFWWHIRFVSVSSYHGYWLNLPDILPKPNAYDWY